MNKPYPVTAENIDQLSKNVLEHVSVLREAIIEFHKQREITCFDVPQMTVTDLIKYARLIVRTCSIPQPPKTS